MAKGPPDGGSTSNATVTTPSRAVPAAAMPARRPGVSGDSNQASAIPPKLSRLNGIVSGLSQIPVATQVPSAMPAAVPPDPRTSRNAQPAVIVVTTASSTAQRSAVSGSVSNPIGAASSTSRLSSRCDQASTVPWPEPSRATACSVCPTVSSSCRRTRRM